MRETRDIRLFFALWPDAERREALRRAAQTISLPDTARRVPAGNLHLTLHFIGNVYREDMACLRAQARRVRAPAFRLRVDRQGFFDRARVAWLGCSEPPSALFDLQRQLGTHLQECAFQPEARVYNPHITVARKLRSISTEARFAALEWPVDAFALVESQALENGVQYRVVESWPLE